MHIKLALETDPQEILTNRDLAFMKAIAVVFSSTINLLCRFRINKNVSAKYKQRVVKDLQQTIDKLWMDAVWASDEAEYEQQLQ